jgi:transposase
MVKKLLQQRRKTGCIKARHHLAGRKKLIVAEHRIAIRKHLKRKPDMTLAELREALGLECTLPTIHYVLVDMGLTDKKKTLRAAEQDREDVRKARRRWKRKQGGLEPWRLVFLDESGAKTNMTRLRGRAQRGRRLHAAAPCRRWQSTTMISSIRLDGTTACMHLPGAADTAAFVTYIDQVLCPTLKQGDLVVMDNLAVRKSPQVIALDQAVGGEVRLLPAYSPDLNAIEKMWSKIKALLCSAEARTPQELEEAISLSVMVLSNMLYRYTGMTSYRCLWKSRGRVLKIPVTRTHSRSHKRF